MKSLTAAPFVINLGYILVTGFMLVLAPDLMRNVFDVTGTPNYLIRMTGIPVLALAAVAQHGMLRGNARTLMDFGMMQIGVAVLYAVIFAIDHVPSNFQVVTYANAALGLWTFLTARGSPASRLQTLSRYAPRPRFPELPVVVDLAFLLILGMLLFCSPELMRRLLTAPDSVPLYIGRMFGALIFAFFSLGLLGLLHGSLVLLQRLGFVQLLAGLLCAAIIVLDGAPSALWSLAGLNILLGAWTARALRTPGRRSDFR